MPKGIGYGDDMEGHSKRKMRRAKSKKPGKGAQAKKPGKGVRTHGPNAGGFRRRP